LPAIKGHEKMNANDPIVAGMARSYETVRYRHYKLARGAVRERMLFNRLAEGEIELPTYKVQQNASEALAALKPMRHAIEQKLSEINLLPSKILAQAFER
jgi:hypothetical protein